MPEKVTSKERIEQLRRDCKAVVSEGTVCSPALRKISFRLRIVLSLIVMGAALIFLFYSIYLFARGKMVLGDFILSLEALGLLIIGLEILPSRLSGAVIIGSDYVAVPAPGSSVDGDGIADSYDLYEKGSFELRPRGGNRWKLVHGKKRVWLNDEAALAIYTHILRDTAAFYELRGSGSGGRKKNEN